MTKTEEILYRKTRKGAENWIVRAGYEPGVETDDTYWSGQRTEKCRITFEVRETYVGGERRFVVVRTTTTA